MSKQDPYRFNLRFDDTDKDHRKVCDFLNTCGRKKQDTSLRHFWLIGECRKKKNRRSRRKEKWYRGRRWRNIL